MAYLTAATHGLTDEAEKLKAELESKEQNVPEVDPNARLLAPPPPISQLTENWPLLTISKGPFDASLIAPTGSKPVAGKSAKVNAAAFAVEEDGDDAGDAWGGDDDLMLNEDGTLDVNDDEVLGGDEGEGEEGGWDVDDDLALPADVDVKIPEGEENFFAPPSRGHPPTFHWPNNSRLVADHVAAGSFESAARLLSDQIGVISFEPFKQIFLSLYAKSRTVYKCLPLSTSNFAYPLRNWEEGTGKSGLPAISVSLDELTQRLQGCYRLTTEGKFSEAINKLRQILLSVPLLVVDSKQKVAEAQQLIEICRKYLVGLLIESHRRTLPTSSLEDQLRGLELAAYFTHCDLQPPHEILTLRTAVKSSFTLKNFKMCASFAQRCLELGKLT